MDCKHTHQTQQGILRPIFNTIHAIRVIEVWNTEGVTMFDVQHDRDVGSARTKQYELVWQTSVICECRVIMGIMTGLFERWALFVKHPRA